MPHYNNPNLAGAGGQGGAYEIEQSLRFDQGGYFSRTFSSSGDRNNWTFSVWLKRSGGIGDNDRDIFCGYNSGARLGLIECGTGYPGGPADQFGVDRGGDASAGVYYTNGRYRDPSAWYHLVVSVDYTNATQANRARIFVNGVNYGAAYNDLASGDGQINGNWSHWIGQRDGGSTSNRWDGYMAELHFLDGITVTDASSFGESDANGVWRPIEYTGSYGTNGFYLKFDPSATNGIGHDHSGNGNNWTPTGFTTSGTGADVMSDTPTTNWATLNPLNVNILNSATLTNGNLQLNASSIRYANAKSTFVASQFNNYCEVDITTRSGGSLIGIGVGDATANIALGAGNFTTYREVGEIRVYPGNVLAGTVASYTQGDVIGMAIDSTNVKFYKNGTLQGTYAHSLTGDYFAVGLAYNDSASTVIDFNFGQRAFAYTPPTGYNALNTANLPAPDIADGSQYFDTKLYTANNQTAQTITGLGFSPDLLWFKPRSRAEHHYLYDQVRGAGNRISSSQTIAEITGDNSLTAFTSDGFSLGVDGAGIVNYGTDSMVAWAWDAGGTGSSNTDGTITSTVSANPTAGFSIATYTGNGTAGATVGHGLGVAPRMIMVKRRDTGTDWAVYHASTGATKYLTLNNTNSAGTSSAYWNNTEPTSTLFSLGLSGEANTNGGTFVAYCFAEVEGYSKFGSYTGNGSASGDGTFVYLGFRPAFFMIKGPSGFDWYLFDNQRPGYNEKTYRLFPNLASSENVDQVGCDFVSNGVKLRSGNANVSSAVYYYAAFGENPFGGSGISPATAR
jgi:hypothetical protein